MRRSLLIFTFLLSAACAHAQSPALVNPAGPIAKEPAQGNVAIELRCLSLPQALAVPLIRRLRSGDLAEQSKVMTELDELLTAGKVTLQGWLVATTHGAEKAAVEDIEEIRYGTEFLPMRAEVFLADRDGSPNSQPDSVKVDAEPIASGFDTRNLGVTLEVQPTIAADGKSLVIDFMAQHVRLKSVDRIVVEREFTTEKKSQKTSVEQPRFTTFKVQTSFTMKSGEHRLIGIFRGPEGDKTLEIFILSAELMEAK